MWVFGLVVPSNASPAWVGLAPLQIPLWGLFTQNVCSAHDPTAGPGAQVSVNPWSHVILSVSLDIPNWVLRKWISLVSVRKAVPRVTPKQKVPTATWASLDGQPCSQQKNTCRKKPLSLPWPLHLYPLGQNRESGGPTVPALSQVKSMKTMYWVSLLPPLVTSNMVLSHLS